MKNYGTARVKVNLINKLPYVRRKILKYTFDLSAESYKYAKQNPEPFTPLLTEYLEGEAFSTCYPEQRKLAIDNYLDNGKIADPASTTTTTGVTKPSTPYILLTPTTSIDSFSYLNTILKPGGTTDTTINFTTYTLIKPKDYTSTTPSTYLGPIWEEIAIPQISYPNDAKVLESFWSSIFNGTISVDQGYFQDTKDFRTVYQSRPLDGLWWGLETSEFLYDRQAFYVTIKRQNIPQTSSKYPSFFYISFGSDCTSYDKKFDLYLRLNDKPQIIDYCSVSKNDDGTKKGKEIITDLGTGQENELSKLFSSTKDIEIGFMNVAGRLIIFINEFKFVYTRPMSTGTSSAFREIDIPGKPIRIYGSNVAAQVYVSPMIFSPYGMLIAPILNSVGTTSTLSYSAINQYGNAYSPKKPVCVLPHSSSDKTNGNVTYNYGADCHTFYDTNGSVTTSGTGFHEDGYVYFYTLKTYSDSNSQINADTFSKNYMLLMETALYSMKNFTTNIDHKMAYGCPYFFRISGIHQQDQGTITTTETDITDDVISVSENVQAPDMFQVKKSATIVLYNKNGTYDYLKTAQKGIKIEWAWDGSGWASTYTKTFTGLTNGATSNESPGKETLTVQCEDYMHILSKFFIINSPIYDGMLAYSCILDLSARALLVDGTFDWQGKQADYFLPSGYAFTSPVMRFPSNNTVLDCMLQVAKKFEAYIYFDEDGKFHVDYIPGGIIYSVPTGATVTKFSVDPDSTDTVILDEKSLEFSLDSTVNGITGTTVDRDTLAIIIKGKSATTTQDKLLFEKRMFIDQAAYGGKAELEKALTELEQRVYYPIRKISFKTVGNTIVKPLTFITLDKKYFRVMGIKRDFDAEKNDFTQSIEAKWLGGS